MGLSSGFATGTVITRDASGAGTQYTVTIAGNDITYDSHSMPTYTSTGGVPPPDDSGSRPGDDVGDWDEGVGDEGPRFGPITTKAELNLHLGRHKAEDEEREGSRYGLQIGDWLRANVDAAIPLGGADGADADLGDAGPDMAERARSSGIQISLGGGDGSGWDLETNPRAFVALSEQVLAQAVVQSPAAIKAIATAIRANGRTGKRIDATMTRANIHAMPKILG